MSQRGEITVVPLMTLDMYPLPLARADKSSNSFFDFPGI